MCLGFNGKVGLVNNYGACKIKSQKAWFCFQAKESRITRSHLTKRAPDAGDSAHIPSIFHALSFFWLDGFAVPAPAQVTQTVGQYIVKENLA